MLIVSQAEIQGILRSHPWRLFLPVAALVVILAPALVLFAFRERAGMVAQVGVSTATFFSVLLGLLSGSAALGRERSSGLRDVLLSRRLSAAEYVFGKWIGIAGAGALAVFLLGLVHGASVAFRGGPPRGWVPIVYALTAAAAAGGLAAAAGLLFSSLLRPGAAFSAALLFVLGSHAAALAGDGGWLRIVLPRLPEANLAAEAAFGPLPGALVAVSLLHLLLYTGFLLSLTALASKT